MRGGEEAEGEWRGGRRRKPRVRGGEVRGGERDRIFVHKHLHTLNTLQHSNIWHVHTYIQRCPLHEYTHPTYEVI